MSSFEQIESSIIDQVVEPSRMAMQWLGCAGESLTVARGTMQDVASESENPQLHNALQLYGEAVEKARDATYLLADMSEQLNVLARTWGFSTDILKIPGASGATTAKLDPGERADASRSGAEASYGAEPHDSPLDVVRHVLSSTTDRNPADADAIMAMIQKAMDELGDRAAPFANALLDNLDPYMGKRFDGQNSVIVGELGALAADEEVSRAARWGAVSLLGVVAMARLLSIP